MSTLHFVDGSGNYLGGFADGAEPPAGAVPCDAPPCATARLVAGVWVVPPEVPELITKIQLVRALRDHAPPWDATAEPLWTAWQTLIEAHPDWPYVTQIPRHDPRGTGVAAGIAAAMGVSPEQAEAMVDAIWILGATL